MCLIAWLNCQFKGHICQDMAEVHVLPPNATPGGTVANQLSVSIPLACLGCTLFGSVAPAISGIHILLSLNEPSDHSSIALIS